MSQEMDNSCVSFNNTASVEQCTSVPATPVVNPVTAGVYFMQRVLAERTVSTSLDSNITFPDPVLEIKDIKKRVKITQCSLMLPPVEPGVSPFTPAPGTLFLKGFVRKNIQYATPVAGTDDCVTSNLRSLTFDVPFQCSIVIPAFGEAGGFITAPQRPVLNTRAEFDFFRAQPLGEGFPEKDQLLSSDLSQFHQTSTRAYNQLPFCVLVSDSITEWDQSVDRQPLSNLGINGPFEEGTFRNMSEKLTLSFTIKVIQNQQITSP